MPLFHYLWSKTYIICNRMISLCFFEPQKKTHQDSRWKCKCHEHLRSSFIPLVSSCFEPTWSETRNTTLNTMTLHAPSHLVESFRTRSSQSIPSPGNGRPSDNKWLTSWCCCDTVIVGYPIIYWFIEGLFWIPAGLPNFLHHKSKTMYWFVCQYCNRIC